MSIIYCWRKTNYCQMFKYRYGPYIVTQQHLKFSCLQTEV